MKSYTIDELVVGQKDSMTKTVSESDVYLFAGISGDFNPAHVDAEYARTTIFKERIAHGILTAGFISAVIGTKLPGPGTIYLKQDLVFQAPVLIGTTVRAIVEVKELIKEKNRAILLTTCVDSTGKVLLSGEATVMAPKAAK